MFRPPILSLLLCRPYLARGVSRVCLSRPPSIFFPPHLFWLGIVSRRARAVVYLTMTLSKKDADAADRAIDRTLNPKPDTTGSLVLHAHRPSASASSAVSQDSSDPNDKAKSGKSAKSKPPSMEKNVSLLLRG